MPRGRALAPVPAHVVTGFLGAGKTTLVNRWLTDPRGERLAVVVNEFGDLGIDGRLVVASDEEVLELANGCICCTVRTDLVDALRGLLDRRRRRLAPRRFDRLVIETSGLASPGPVLQTLALEERLAAELVPAAVVTVAHAAHVGDQLARHPEAAEQVGYADAVLLNHADEVDADALAAARTEVRRRNPLAELHVGRHGDAGVDLRAAELRRTASDVPVGRAEAHGHGEAAGAVALTSETPLDLHRLKLWLQLVARAPDHELWRIKGLVACRDVPEEVVVQGVYQTLEVGPGRPFPPARSELVILGRNLDADVLRRGWEHCRSAS